MPPKRSRAKAEEAAPEAALEAAPLQRQGTVTEKSILAGTVPFERITSEKDFDTKAMYKIITWNMAGLRAVARNHEEGFLSLMHTEAPDVLCVQETKLQSDDSDYLAVPGYSFYDSFSMEKKGYSGTRVYVKDGIPHDVTYGLDGAKKADPEGRIIIVSLPTFVVVNAYVPNVGMKLERLTERIKKWDPKMEACLANLQKTKPVIWTGDLNVAERDYDRYFTGSFNQMQKSPGFTPEERSSFRGMLDRTKMVDAFRQLYPTAVNAYSFWSTRFGGKAKGQGWRLDYFVISRALLGSLVDSFMMPDVSGSDHCPCVLWIKR